MALFLRQRRRRAYSSALAVVLWSCFRVGGRSEDPPKSGKDPIPPDLALAKNHPKASHGGRHIRFSTRAVVGSPVSSTYTAYTGMIMHVTCNTPRYSVGLP